MTARDGSERSTQDPEAKNVYGQAHYKLTIPQRATLESLLEATVEKKFLRIVFKVCDAQGRWKRWLER